MSSEDSPVRVSAPGSIANLGPGFDVFALALEEPRDFVEMSFSDDIRISDVSGYDGIPRDPNLNSVTLAARRVFKMAGYDWGFEVSIEKGVEIGKGMGSSGAGASAGAAAANHLLGNPLGDSKLIEAAGFAEEKIAGSAHYDNVAASIVGGFVIIASDRPPQYRRIDPPEMRIMVAAPEKTASTRKGRKNLPESVSLRGSVANVSRASFMVSALQEGDIETFSQNMIDSIVEPIRVSEMDGVNEVKESALDAGALGAAMSGSGPSVFAILESDADAGEVKKAMKQAFERESQKCKIYETTTGNGVRIESK